MGDKGEKIMEYVLIWIIFGYSTIATASQEFGNKASCEAAKSALLQQAESRAICVPKR